MESQRPARVLVISDRLPVAPALLDAVRARAAGGDVQFRLIVPNPARAETGLLHPDRHQQAAEAEVVLRKLLPSIEVLAGSHVIGSVSLRHDPMDAVEDILFNEPIDELIISVVPHGLGAWLHQDLPHRLKHFGLPITTVHET